jgi:hypothetical protein
LTVVHYIDEAAAVIVNEVDDEEGIISMLRFYLAETSSRASSSLNFEFETPEKDDGDTGATDLSSSVGS